MNLYESGYHLWFVTICQSLLQQVASGLTGPAKSGILALCEEVDSLSQQLSEMCRRGQGETPQAQAVARWVKLGHG